MPLVMNEEQRLLQDTAVEFLAANSPVTALRKLRDERDPLGYDPQLWQQMTELGWASIILPEMHGGLDFGFLGLGIIMEACGRTLTASPLFATAVVGASALLLGGSEKQKVELLPEIAAGKFTLALAVEESQHHRPRQIATSALAQGGGFLLNGSKTFVLDGHSADSFIVVARSHGDERDSDGLSLFLVDRKSVGISCRRTLMVDNRNAANLHFEQVRVPGDALIGELGKGWNTLEPVLDRGQPSLASFPRCFDFD